MRLTKIPHGRLPQILSRFSEGLEGNETAASAFASIAETAERIDAPADTLEHRSAAVGLAKELGMYTIDEAPQQAFSWNGCAVRTQSEASVLIHEVAHWLIVPPERRDLLDFGLGAGPETGRIQEADAARCVDDATKEWEELLASLLGILLEAKLCQPAIHAFIEQNWLEGWERPAAAEQFASTIKELRARRLISEIGVPILP